MASGDPSATKYGGPGGLQTVFSSLVSPRSFDGGGESIRDAGTAGGGALQSTGMRRKWERHFPHGRWLLLGRCLVLEGLVLLAITSLIWGQLLFPAVLESKVAFEAVLDAQDQQAAAGTYEAWTGPSTSGGESRMSLYRLWHVRNPADVVELGFKPQLEERGPYGYLPRETKYDVEFSESDDSRTVNYKQWRWLEAPASAEDCRELLFNMGEAPLRLNALDCTGDDCLCLDAAEDVVTVVNPPFLRLMEEDGPSGLLAALSQEAFATIHTGMTVDFVNAVRGVYLPQLVESAFQFRRAAALSSLLDRVWEELQGSMGTAAALTALRSDADESTLTACPDDISTCPWGTLDYIAEAAARLGVANSTLSLSDREARGIIGLSSSSGLGSVLNADLQGGMPSWTAAAWHVGALEAPLSITGSEPYAAAREQQYEELVDVMCGWGGSGGIRSVCEAKVQGVVRWLFQGWWLEGWLSDSVAQEWVMGTSSPCDPLSLIDCGWGLRGASPSVLPVEAARLTLDPQEARVDNALSVHLPNGLDDWRRAHTYCLAAVRDCAALEDSVLSTEGSLMPAMVAAGAAADDSAICEVAGWLFGDWAAGGSSWVNHTVAAHLNESLYSVLGGQELRGDSLEDVGYAQWAGGHITNVLYGLRSITTMARMGIWNLQPGLSAEYQASSPEFWARAARTGYPHMSLSLPASRSLLSLLADPSSAGTAFRAHLVRQSTTIWGEEASGAALGFVPGDALFADENVEADFSWPTLSDEADLELSSDYSSSPEQCQVLEGVYETCNGLVQQLSRWASECSTFQTIMSDPSRGIECDNVRAGNVPHPRPMRPGNVLASMIYDVAWTLVLKDGGMVCSGAQESGSNSCDLAAAGLFTTQTASSILFDGYVDPVVVKLLNFRYAERGLSLTCSDQVQVEGATTDTCEPVYSATACWSSGFDVVHRTLGTVLQVRPEGPLRYLWYEAELDLPHGLGTVRNPSFAIYPGATWENETFHRRSSCEGRMLGGDAGQWLGCDTEQLTGRAGLERIREHMVVAGNSTLRSPAEDSPLDVEGGDGWQSQPFAWAGIDRYRMWYWSRSGMTQQGSRASGAASVALLDPRHLMLYEMQPVPQAVGGLEHRLRYPAPKTFEDAWGEAAVATATVSQPVNRYWARVEDWEAARDRGGTQSMRDANGMAYRVPHGMASLSQRSGFPVFASDPHFRSNFEYYSADQPVEYDWNQVSGTDPDDTAHRSFADVDPVTGRSLRRALRTQINLRLERSSFAPLIMSNKARVPTCDPPTKDFLPDGAGCYMYIPLFWEAEEAVLELADAERYKREFWLYPDYVYDVAFYGALIAAVALFLGGCLWGICAWRERVFARRKFVD